MKKKDINEEPVESIEVKEVVEEEVLGEVKVMSENLASWKPKTELGRKVKNQE